PTNTPVVSATRTNTATPTPTVSSYTFTGTITNAVTGAPVAGAVFHAFQCNSSQSAQATSATNGTYSLTVPAGVLCSNSTLQVTASGYITQSPAWTFQPAVSNYVVNVALQPATTGTPTMTNTPTNTPITPTSTPGGNSLSVKIQSAGTDNTQQSQFNF